MEITLAIFSLVISIIALIASLIDTRLVIEYLFSKEYVLLKLKDNKEPSSKTHCYVSNCRLFGIVETNWYVLDISNDDYVDIIINDNFLRDGFPAGLNLQKEYDIILITRSGERFYKKIKKRK